VSNLGEVVNVGDLWKTVVAALIARVGVVFLFSVTVIAVGHVIESSREERHVVAGAWATLPLLGLFAALGAIVLGVIVMTHKS
jgi:hypothetical protein